MVKIGCILVKSVLLLLYMMVKMLFLVLVWLLEIGVFIKCKFVCCVVVDNFLVNSVEVVVWLINIVFGFIVGIVLVVVVVMLCILLLLFM